MTGISKAPLIARSAVQGGVRLSYDKIADSGTRLIKQWVRPPLHLAKAYHEEDWAVSLLTSPTAGLLDGDRLEVTAEVGVGAKAALISPAACRVHTMGGGSAEVEQYYRVASGGILDVWPAPLILQKDAVLRQSTQIDVAEDATVLFCEVIAPGRAAYGECFEFAEWRSRLSIRAQGRLLAYENFSCLPGQGDLADWRKVYKEGIYAGLYYLSPRPLDTMIQTLHDLDEKGVHLGASSLREGGLGIKILAKDGITLRKSIHSVRKLLIAHTEEKFPNALLRSQTFFH